MVFRVGYYMVRGSDKEVQSCLIKAFYHINPPGTYLLLARLLWEIHVHCPIMDFLAYKILNTTHILNKKYSAFC